MSSCEAIALVPARYGSSRFPGKPLANRTGKPLIQHVVQQIQQARRVASVHVATDDERIAEAVAAFGGSPRMTRSDHPNGTARIAEAVEGLAPSSQTILLNVQGDEPELPPEAIDALVDRLAAEPPAEEGGAELATLASPFSEDEDPDDPNIVKVVLDEQARALYFSRARIPYPRETEAAFLKHAGMYAYRARALADYAALPPTALERTEALEQLRALGHGRPMAVARHPLRHHGIDTPQQYEAFVTRMGAGRLDGAAPAD